MVAMVFIGIFAVSTGVAVDSDTWWHLAAGRWMVAHHHILTHDEFSWTRAGFPWIYNAWLSQVPMFLVWDRFGFGGLNAATAALVTLAFLFVYLQCEGNAYLKAFTLQLAVIAAGLYWPARPQIISLVLASVFAYVLYLFRWRGLNRLWLLPPLMVLWVNLHGGFVIGFLLLIVVVLGQAASAALRQRGPGVVGWDGVAALAMTGAACAALVPLNPHGGQMYTFAFQTVSLSVLRDFIQEWMSPNFHVLGAQGFIWLLLATFAAVGLSRRRIDLTDLLLVAVFSYLALLAGRNIAIFALIAAPVLARHAAAGLGAAAEGWPRWASLSGTDRESGSPRAAVHWVLLALIVGVALARVAIPLQRSVNLTAIGKSMPLGAAEFVQTSRPRGPMFNSYNWGGYLAWTLAPAYPVYVDGRTDLYSDAFLREYILVTTVPEAWQPVFDREGIRLAVIEQRSLLAEELRRAPGWRVAYSDALAAVFVRK
jgi:hypothetical protein